QRDGADGAREDARPRRRSRACGQGARPRLVPRHAGRRRRLVLVRGGQRQALPQQHPVRRPRRAARSLDGGPHRPWTRAHGHGRVRARLRARAPRARLHPPHATSRRPVVRALGVNYIYGTWSVFRGLKAIGESFEQEYIQRAVRWLESHQNPDGGWGETCESYDDPSLAGRGTSTPSQTAWALLALLAAGRARTDV